MPSESRHAAPCVVLGRTSLSDRAEAEAGQRRHARRPQSRVGYRPCCSSLGPRDTSARRSCGRFARMGARFAGSIGTRRRSRMWSGRSPTTPSSKRRVPASRRWCTPRRSTSLHVATHSARAFIDVNVNGTQTLLDAAIRANVRAFVYTSTTEHLRRRARACGRGSRRMASPGGHGSRFRRTSTASRRPRRKISARSPIEIPGSRAWCSRTSRFFPEDDDDPAAARRLRRRANLKTNEYLCTGASTSRTS